MCKSALGSPFVSAREPLAKIVGARQQHGERQRPASSTPSSESSHRQQQDIDKHQPRQASHPSHPNNTFPTRASARNESSSSNELSDCLFHLVFHQPQQQLLQARHLEQQDPSSLSFHRQSQQHHHPIRKHLMFHRSHPIRKHLVFHRHQHTVRQPIHRSSCLLLVLNQSCRARAKPAHFSSIRQTSPSSFVTGTSNATHLG